MFQTQDLKNADIVECLKTYQDRSYGLGNNDKATSEFQLNKCNPFSLPPYPCLEVIVDVDIPANK